MSVGALDSGSNGTLLIKGVSRLQGREIFLLITERNICRCDKLSL